MKPLIDRMKYRSGLLLMLAAALVGFFLLINLLGSVTSSGPNDLLATNPSDERHIGLPSGVGMFSFGVGAVGVVLGIVAVIGVISLVRRNTSGPSRWYLAIGAIVAFLLAGAGLYLAFSGVLSHDIAYGEHQAQRPFVQPKGLAVMGAFSLTLVLVGFFRPRLLLAHLGVWLVMALIFGFFGSSSLAGLNLFEETEESGIQEAYSAEVEKFRKPKSLREAAKWDSIVPLENGNSALTRGMSLLLKAGASALPGSGPISNPLFTVSGADHTSRLRSATGDLYENGEWTQLDPVSLDSQTWSDIPREMLDLIDQDLADQNLGQSELESLLSSGRINPDLLAQPSAVPESLNIDHISVSPADGLESLEPGTLPLSALPLGIQQEGKWNPFSRTFESEEEVDSYEFRSMAGGYLESALAEANGVDDPTYLQLPGNLPQRVRELAGEITEGTESPYEKARAIEQYLKSEYSYSVPNSGEQPLLPPVDQDPVDWFLFDQKSGGATSFSSAFCVLARASDVPARVVSGWAISPTPDEQVVYSDQSHQWAEVGLQEFGWIPFDPTPGGAKERVASRHPEASAQAGAGLGERIPDEATSLEQKPQDSGPSSAVAPAEPSPPEEQAPEFLEEIALQNLADALDPEVREGAAEILGDVGSDRALEGLADAMFNDPDEAVRETSIDSMASQGFERLQDILQHHPDPQMRRAAAICLGRKGDGRALNPLSDSLVQKPDTDQYVRAAAATALGDLLKPEAIEPLSQALESDQSTNVRKACAAALGALGQRSGVGSLEQALSDDSEEDVRAEAADALGDLLSPDSLPELLEGRANDPSPKVRGACSNAVSRFSSSGLSQALEQSEDPSVRSSAAQVLGEQGDSDGANDLINALQDTDESVRETAQEAVENLGTVTSLESGAGLLSHSSGTSMIPGTTTGQAAELPHAPVFEVEAGGDVNFLRTAVGDRYENGQWYPDQQNRVPYSPESPVPNLGSTSLVTTATTSKKTVPVTVRPAAGTEWIPEGNIPISAHPSRLSVGGTLFPNSETFASNQQVSSYNWTSDVPVFSEAQLGLAGVSPSYGHTSVPEGMPGRVRSLAQKITSGQRTPYQKARAIERYLKTNYTYRLADPSSAGIPAGHDPVDWFLFESRVGTCGNFSSAFVILARSVGLSARVVSGWSISPTKGSQTVYSDQAHQRAEVAFDGFGWIPFEPTASGGAPGRAEGGNEGSSISQTERQEIQNLAEQLSGGQPASQEQAIEQLENSGAEVTQTENGGAVVTRDGECFGLGVGTTTLQVERPKSSEEGGSDGEEGISQRSPVFFVTGAAHTRYLRSAVGEVYEGGTWRQLNRISMDYDNSQSIPHLVRNEITKSGSGAYTLPAGVSNSTLLSGFDESPRVTYTDNIVIEASPKLGNLPAGVVPTSQFLDEVDIDGQFHPVSGTFSLDRAAQSFSWVSRVPQFSQAQLEAATVLSDPAYTQLPSGMPQRVRDLALEITAGHDSPYGKARALESYLSTTYTYRFADGSGREAPPPGRDPVDWFLFEHLEGSCGVFSTAFVVMARSIGIPARVASGWAISSSGNRQEVFTDQAHQWAEVAFEGLGWVQFEPTAPLGAPSRAAPPGEDAPGTQQQEDDGATTQLDEPEAQQQGSEDTESPSAEEQATETPVPPEPEIEQQPVSNEEEDDTQIEDPQPTEEITKPPDPVSTETAITSWPADVRRKKEFIISGTVRTTGGSPVSGVEVEIFINETKEHGGTKIGQTTAEGGNFMTGVNLPSSMPRGPYQLLAHVVGNDQYVESWSDPDITVYSESGIQLTGPGEVPIDTQALFHGKLLDDTGGGVSNQELQVSVNGRDLPAQTTDDAGEFGFAQTFSEVGPQTVEVGFEGKDFLLGNTARLELAAVMPTLLNLTIPGEVRVGDTFPLEGQLLDARGDAVSGVDITFTVGEGPPWTAVTEDDGSFATTGATDTVGDSVIRAGYAGTYPVLPSEHSSTVTARYLTGMTISGPSSVLQGEEALFQGRLTSASPTDIGSLDVLIEDRDGTLLDAVSTADDGSFEYRSTGFEETGPRVVTARFREQQRLTSSSASLSLFVVAPTKLTVEGPAVVTAGKSVELSGLLRTTEGEPVPGAAIWVGGPGSQPLITNGEGAFSREFPLEAELGASDVEATVNISFGFEGTDRLAPSLRNHAIAVGIPWVSVEPTEAAVRGGMATLRGAVFVGNRPLPGATVTAEPGTRAVSNDTGAFVLQYPVSSDSPLGRTEIVVSVTDLNLQVAVPLDIKSAVNLVVVPLEDVRPGESVVLQATLTNDNGQGVSGASLITSQGEGAITGDTGASRLRFTVPDSEEKLAVPITFTYDGDSLHLPLSYTVGIPITQPRFNWVLLVGLPALVLAVLVSVYAARRWGAFVSSTGAQVSTPERREVKVDVAVLDDAGLFDPVPEPEPEPDPEATRLTISIEKIEDDLPEVFGLGEQVTVLLNLTVENEGPGIPQATVFVETPTGERHPHETDTEGKCGHTWEADLLGVHNVSAEFEETRLYLASTDTAAFSVVDFREEIVRLYNEFVDWAEGQTRGTTGRTPRELEAVLVSSGLPLDFRAVDEVISRFEEADYSEHPIGRRQYGAMYRAWFVVVGNVVEVEETEE